MLVRMAEKKDIPDILRLLVQVNKVHADLRPDLFKYSTKYNEKEVEELLKDSLRPVFVCVGEDDKVKGYGICVMEDYGPVDVRTDIKSIYIDDICVDSACRRQGVAKSIYEAICKFAKEEGCYNITLNVWEGNDSAKHFYDDMGFKPLKTTLEVIL